MIRCPELYLEDVNISRDLSFLLAKDPNFLGLSGWIVTYSQNLKSILYERNSLINIAANESTKETFDLRDIERQMDAQAAVSNAEVVNAYQLIQLLTEASHKIEAIIMSDYKDVVGPKLKSKPPEILGKLMPELEQIARSAAPDWPPEPPGT